MISEKRVQRSADPLLETELIKNAPKSIINNHYSAKLFNYNFQLLKAVSRNRDSQPQVVEDYVETKHLQKLTSEHPPPLFEILDPPLSLQGRIQDLTDGGNSFNRTLHTTAGTGSLTDPYVLERSKACSPDNI